jgi:hypothetical protein
MSVYFKASVSYGARTGAMLINYAHKLRSPFSVPNLNDPPLPGSFVTFDFDIRDVGGRAFRVLGVG